MNILSEIEFALKHGFTNVEKGLELDGSTYFKGTFGYISTNDDVMVQAIEHLLSQYIKKEESLEDVLNKTFGTKWEVKSSKIKSELNKHCIKVEKLKVKPGMYAYIFKVKDTKTVYQLSATQKANGVWWLKEGQCRY